MGKFDPNAYLNDFNPSEYLAEPDPMGTDYDRIAEPLKAIAGGVGTEVAAGLSGIAQTLNPLAEEGAGAQMVQDVREAAPDFSPKTQAGQAGMETVQDLVNAGIDVANMSLSGLEGLSMLIRGQGVDKAVETIRDIQERGISANLGDRALEATDSPLLATAAHMAPEALMAMGALPAKAAAVETAQTIGRGLQAGARPAVQTGREIVEGASKLQTPAKRDMVAKIEAGSQDPSLAGYEVAQRGVQLDGRDPDLPLAEDPTGIERFFDTKGPRVKADPVARRAIKQGWREGVIQPIKNASAPDKDLMRKMTGIAERARKDELFGMENRPGDVAGDLLMSRLDVIRQANKRAGQDIKPIVLKMRGQPVDIRDAGANFTVALEDMGVGFKRGDDGKPARDDSNNLMLDFDGSDIEGIPAAENVITKVVDRIQKISGDGTIDAFQLHQLKKFIDEHVTFGKSAEGLSGQSERALKQLRANINKTLGENFKDYAKANETYSGTIDALDAFQDVAGRKMNLLGDNADKATGTLMRRLMSNAQSRITLLDALEGIDTAVDKFSGYGGPLRIEGKGGAKNDLKMLVLYADELDRILGSAPRTSLQGQFDQAFGTAARAATSKSGAFEAGVDIVGKGLEKARGINEDNAIKTINELLKKKSK